ncbi:class A beta-lactamase-related serine hydrolase [Segetibacter sp. 3557_3]|uniref:serine hydrolase domain-containing protein n=1 Tax=Segetibacter sp. 3557_3 TaxID=2547429 RepID=UPI001058A330|nr:serine hydrolase domain-containing protein [Segetibacter sp. 3557_3]TDH27488.1 class A beta-lactamase-related serine hydrolase [Segetibacter sp. 3557_3]
MKHVDLNKRLLNQICFGWFLLLLQTSITAQPTLTRAVTKATESQARFQQRMDKLINSYVDSGWISGAVALVAKDGRLVYEKAVGLAAPGSGDAMRVDNIFRIASQTKAITSVAIMMLFEDGKLLLDDPISKYIPTFAKPAVVDQYNAADTTYTTVPAKREITIRDLLTHTSGIDYAGIGSAKMRSIYAKAGIPSGIGDGTTMLKEKMVALGKVPLVHQPGERYTYGLNTDLLGYLVEVLSGMSLDQFFTERIFRPLEMNDTYFYLPADKHARLVPVNAIVSGKLQSAPVQATNYPRTRGMYYSGGAGLSSTIRDYAVFLQMMLNGGVYNNKRMLSKRSVELMTTNQIGDLNVGVDKFGLGFQITSERGFAKLGVSKGSFAWGGYFGTTYWVDPAEKLVCLLFVQQMGLRGEVHDKFKATVYTMVE